MHPYPKLVLIKAGVTFFKSFLLLKYNWSFIYPTFWRHSVKKKNVDIINTEQCKTQHKHRLHIFYTVPTKTTLILLTLLTESRCACNFRPNSGSACPKFLTARSRINFWVLIRWFPMFSTNRSLSSGFSTFKDSVVHESQAQQPLLRHLWY